MAGDRRATGGHQALYWSRGVRLYRIAHDEAEDGEEHKLKYEAFSSIEEGDVTHRKFTHGPSASGAHFDVSDYFDINGVTGEVTLRWAMPDFEAQPVYHISVIVDDVDYYDSNATSSGH